MSLFSSQSRRSASWSQSVYESGELLRPVFDAGKDPDDRVEIYILVQCGRRDDVLYVDVCFVFDQRAHLSDI
jgi:hypothetical protein